MIPMRCNKGKSKIWNEELAGRKPKLICISVAKRGLRFAADLEYQYNIGENGAYVSCKQNGRSAGEKARPSPLPTSSRQKL